MFYVYIIFNNINGKAYIGKTKNLHKRWIDHQRVARTGKRKYPKLYKAIHSAISKYGVNNFEFSAIQSFLNESEAYKAEIYWISFFNSKNPKYGYNISPGGLGTGSGKDSPNFGLKRSIETIQKLSESHKGEKNSNYKKVFSSETRAKMSLSQKGNQLGESHGKAVLSENIVRNLKLDYKNLSLSKKELSEKYHIKYDNVLAILNGRSWTHIIVD